MRVRWYRVKKTYEKPQGGFLAIGPRYPGVSIGSTARGSVDTAFVQPDGQLTAWMVSTPFALAC